MDELKEQIVETLRNLERGEVMMGDRVFLNHVLEEFEHLVVMSEIGGQDMGEVANEMIGSTRELVEDGLGVVL